MPHRQRRDMFAVHLSVDGINWSGNNVWTTKTGGEATADSVKVFPGAMEPQVSLGGRKTTGNVTLTRPYEERDHGRMQQLMDAVGKARCTVQQQPLDPDGNVWGKPIVYGGVLIRVTPPDADSSATTDPAMIEVEIDTDGDAYVG